MILGTIYSLINSWIAEARTKQTIRNIRLNNKARRNITEYQPSDIEGFIERDPHVGSYIISGGICRNRSRAVASAVACALDQNVPVIVLHEGNLDLQNQIRAATAFTGNKVIIAKNTEIYDPFYNRTDQEICNIIINSAPKNSAIGAKGNHYIIGMSEFIKSDVSKPYCGGFLSCGLNDLHVGIDRAVSNGIITCHKADQIRDLLMQGQNEEANIQSFFSQLACQGRGIISNRGSRSSAVNIRTAAAHNGMLMIDIGSSTNEILLNLIMNEIKEILSTGKQIMLVLDGININSNETLSGVLRSLSSRCLTVLTSDDVYSMLGAEDSLFNTFIGNACKCIVYSHTAGVSCTKFSEVFGYYDVDKVSRNSGNNENYQWGYGYTSSKSITVSTDREFVVKPEEISRMAENEVYILDRNAKELAHTTLK